MTRLRQDPQLSHHRAEPLPSRDGAGAGLQDVADHDVSQRRGIHAGALHHRLQDGGQKVIGGGGLESLFV